MNATISAWLFLRLLRWLGWLAFLTWSAYFWWDPSPHLNQFSHLKTYCEVIWFGTANFAVFAGFFEMMLRARAGLARPQFGQLIPPQATEPAMPLAR
jgi:hypothetical protein